MTFDFDNERPIYIQLVELFKNEIISEKMKSGNRLPSVRELSAAARVNPNTIQKALAELENIGLIYTESTNGKFITKNIELLNKIRIDLAKKKAESYLISMNNIGIDKNKAIEILQDIGGKE